LAEEQSAHLYLCHLIADLTQRYGPVIRQATVVGVLDAAFDVLIPEFGIEKRVHIDQMPIEVRTCSFNKTPSSCPLPEPCL
jgi:protein SSD1